MQDIDDDGGRQSADEFLTSLSGRRIEPLIRLPLFQCEEFGGPGARIKNRLVVGDGVGDLAVQASGCDLPDGVEVVGELDAGREFGGV